MVHYDVVVIGAGAAGLMCATEAGRRGRSVLLVDHSATIGKKILISGGGRCNFTNLHLSAANFLSRNPHFCKSALSRFPPSAIVALLEKYGVRYEEREHGQLFCAESAKDILRVLVEECRTAGVTIVLEQKVEKVRKTEIFEVATNSGIFTAQSLVVATGGFSYPRVGASGFGYDLARQFGLQVTELRPGLTPLLFSPEMALSWRELAGVSLDAVVSCGKERFREAVLFTHRGLSGPAILQISSYWREGYPILIDLLPDVDLLRAFADERKGGGAVELHSFLSRYLPARLAKSWCRAEFPSRPVKQYREKEIAELNRRIHGWKVVPAVSEGYPKAEVTLGGVDTDELSSQTMESRKVKGLYFIGEVVDVTGHLGGFNFQWAWSSGFAAGQYA
ncbi:MAG: hypothetical protein A2Z34_05545 [Planctomycetes bacterium RBG_16_59_8]|nr:MAG: hypothetical protein A2Z34_05545 [Planctomycetes bacterium RBG_16_59_8]